MDSGDQIADERDRWCVPNGMDWSINPVPESGNPDGEDRLIIVLDLDGLPRVVRPTGHEGFVSIAGLKAITRLGRFKVNLVVQYSNRALRIADALQRAVTEQEAHRRGWRGDDSSDSSVAVVSGVLDREEIVALLDARPKPDWIRGLSANSQRLCALIDAAVEGRMWAVPFVFPVQHGRVRVSRLIDFQVDLWKEILGGSSEEARMAAGELDMSFYEGNRRFVRWRFNT